MLRWFKRPPDRIISPDGVTHYLHRWHLIPRNRWFNIYLHHFLHSDDDRALHDHPWNNLSILLSGSYTEITHETPGPWAGANDWGGFDPPIETHTVYRRGAFKWRRAESAHRILLHDGPVWTLFITGRVVREWGFLCPQGWRPWRDFVDARDTGRVGRGCD